VTKLTFLFLALTASAATKPAAMAVQPSNPLAAGLVRFYSSTADPTVLVDYASTRNLACTGLTLTPAFGGNELASTGTGSCKGSDVGLPSGPNAPFSLAFWSETSAVLGQGGEQDFMSWGTPNNNAMVVGQLNYDQYAAPNTLFSEGYSALLGSSAVLTPGVWSRDAFTYDGTTLRMFVGGIPVTSQSVAINLTLNGAIAVGERNDGTNPWTGGVGDTAIWNRALSTAEVASDFADPWQAVRPPDSVSCTVLGIPQQCLISGITAVLNAQGQMVLFEPVGPVGQTGAPGQPGSGALIMTCPLTPCVGISANTAQVQNIIAPDPTTGAYTLGAPSAVGTLVHVADTVTSVEIFPTAYTKIDNVLTLATPTGHSLYCVWWMQ
jgi:Concanavalin A-like lectin/glucanases superfamily